jgi:DNA-binding MarR family transcriptional regulator
LNQFTPQQKPQIKKDYPVNLIRGRKAWLSLVQAYLLCDAVLAQKLATLGLKVGEHEVLISLARTPCMTQQDLVKTSFAAKSGISMLVSSMVEKGWIVRKHRDLDTRSKLLYLTTEGLRMAELSIAVQSELLQKMTHTLTDAELDTLEKVMLNSIGQLELMRFEF